MQHIAKRNQVFEWYVWYAGKKTSLYHVETMLLFISSRTEKQVKVEPVAVCIRLLDWSGKPQYLGSTDLLDKPLGQVVLARLALARE